jgi:hypothetical protein
MTKLQRLQAQARMSAENRGHTLAPFSLLAPGNAVSKCTVCNREVQVLTKPAPNQIDVGGEAVATALYRRRYAAQAVARDAAANAAAGVRAVRIAVNTGANRERDWYDHDPRKKA